MHSAQAVANSWRYVWSQREALRQVKTQLRPKNAFGAGSRSVSPGDAMIEDVLQKIEILLHFGCLVELKRVHFPEIVSWDGMHRQRGFGAVFTPAS